MRRTFYALVLAVLVAAALSDRPCRTCPRDGESVETATVRSPAAESSLVVTESDATVMESDASATPSEAVYSGNTNSHKFHRASCRYADCRNCTAKFTTRQEAIAAGYQPGGCCDP